MSYFGYTNLISSFLDPRPVDPGSTLIHIGAYGPYSWRWLATQRIACNILVNKSH